MLPEADTQMTAEAEMTAVAAVAVAMTAVAMTAVAMAAVVKVAEVVEVVGEVNSPR